MAKQLVHRVRTLAWPASAAALRYLAPPMWLELLSLDLSRYDPSHACPVDLVVVGGGPAELVVAQRVTEAGLSMCAIDPRPWHSCGAITTACGCMSSRPWASSTASTP
jgi:lycopene beta-cyclase